MEEMNENLQGEILQRIKSVLAINGEKIAFGCGRPKRIKIINDEDMINLKIALNTDISFEQFLLNI